MITYQTYDNNSQQLQIGGSDTITANGGLVGPFPAYSISREAITTGEGTYINTKYTINVNGTATIGPNQPQDITVKGERQAAVIGETITLMQWHRHAQKNQSAGRLEIEAYGGQANKLKFRNAKLLSIEASEQQEESAGVQQQLYSFVFEAYDEISDGGGEGSIGRTEPEYLLSSAEESWDLSEDQSLFHLSDGTASGEVEKVYNLSHTVSATGMKKYNASNGMDTDGEAFRQAVKWVKTRLVADPFADITKDLMGDATYFPSNFRPSRMNKPDGSELEFTLQEDGYKQFNHVRTVQHDMSAGTYSVTDTWVLSKNQHFATCTFEANVENNPENPNRSVTISATFNGLSESTSADIEATDRYTNAKAAYEVFRPTAFGFAQDVYQRADITGTLRTEAINESYGENKMEGVVTYSATFDDREINIEGASSESVNVVHSNRFGIVNIYAVINIINKPDGPIIQDMATTPVAKTDITVDIVMKKNFGKPNGELLSAEYRPAGAYCAAYAESWNPYTRTYNLSESWEYKPLN
jgi:hypothetical protein